MLAPLVKQHIDVDIDTIVGPTRGAKHVVFARHVAMYLAVLEARLTLTEAASLFARDRRAVAYGLARVEHRRDLEASLDSAMDRMMQQFRTALDHALVAYRQTGTLPRGCA